MYLNGSGDERNTFRGISILIVKTSDTGVRGLKLDIFSCDFPFLFLFPTDFLVRCLRVRTELLYSHYEMSLNI